MRQEAVLRDGAGKSGKIGEGRVSRQSQNKQDRSNAHSVKDALAGDGGKQLREHTSIARLARRRGRDTIRLAKESDTAQHHHENSDYQRKCEACGDRGWLPEGRDTVAYGLHTGHRRAAASKGS